MLGVTPEAVSAKTYNGTLRRNADGTYPVAEVMKWRQQRLERVTKDAATLGFDLVPRP
jgi:hypothetical protein